MYFLVLQINFILLHYEMVTNLEMHETNSATNNGNGTKNRGTVESDTHCTSFLQKSARELKKITVMRSGNLATDRESPAAGYSL